MISPDSLHQKAFSSGLTLFRPKILEIFKTPYYASDLGGDLAAGVTVALLALPLALALGIASVPTGVATPISIPALGLITAVVAGFIISLFGGSRFQIGGPTAAFIPLILLILERHGFQGLILATMMAGVFLILMGLTRMGNLIKFIPWPVTSGFTTGIAVCIILSQIPDFFGFHESRPPPRDFFEKIPWLWSHLPSFHPMDLALGLITLAIVFLWPRWGWRHAPGTIVAIVSGTVIAWLFHRLGATELVTIGSKFGENSLNLGSVQLQLPEIHLSQLQALIGPAVAITLLGAIESLLSAVVADGLTDQRHDSNTELIAQGLANLITPFFCGLPATGAVVRTSANITHGARSPVAGMVHAVVLLILVLLAGRWLIHIPLAVMAAVLLMVAFRMGDWSEIKRAHHLPKSDFLVLIATLVLTVVFDLVVAVEIGMVLAAALFIKKVSDTTEVSRVTERDELESPEQLAHGKKIPDGVLVYRIFGPFLFGAAEKMEAALERLNELPRVLILRLHLVSAMDATALNTFQIVVDRLRKRGVEVILSGLHRQPLVILNNSGLIEEIGRQNVCAHFDEALQRAERILG